MMNQHNLSSNNPHNSYRHDSLLNDETGVSLDSDLNISGEPVVVDNETGLDFIFNFAENVPQEIKDNISKAAEAWGAVITDDKTIEINVGYELNTTGLANASSEQVEVDYSEFRQALAAKASSDNDAIALESLLTDEAISILINNTKENQGKDDVYLDDNDSSNNSTIAVNRSTANALGLDLGDASVDGTIIFDRDVNWDYDTSDSLDGVDFTNVATHEISHVLGFDSSVDDLDRLAGQNLKQLVISGEADLEDIAETLEVEVEDLENILDLFGLGEVAEIQTPEEFEALIAGTPAEPLLESIQPDIFVSEDEYTPSAIDLFRYSDLSSDLGVIDFTTGERDKYFSLDGGNTKIAQFSTGEFLGDGRQTSHWKDNLSLGIMDPTPDADDTRTISSNDLQILDVIGWDTV